MFTEVGSLRRLGEKEAEGQGASLFVWFSLRNQVNVLHTEKANQQWEQS